MTLKVLTFYCWNRAYAQLLCLLIKSGSAEVEVEQQQILSWDFGKTKILAELASELNLRS